MQDDNNPFRPVAAQPQQPATPVDSATMSNDNTAAPPAATEVAEPITSEPMADMAAVPPVKTPRPGVMLDGISPTTYDEPEPAVTTAVDTPPVDTPAIVNAALNEDTVMEPVASPVDTPEPAPATLPIDTPAPTAEASAAANPLFTNHEPTYIEQTDGAPDMNAPLDDQSLAPAGNTDITEADNLPVDSRPSSIEDRIAALSDDGAGTIVANSTAKKQQKLMIALIAVSVVAVVAAGGCFYFYQQLASANDKLAGQDAQLEAIGQQTDRDSATTNKTESNLTALQTKVEDLTKERDDLNTKKTEADKSIKDLTEKNKTLTDENTKLNDTVKNNRDLQTRVDELLKKFEQTPATTTPGGATTSTTNR
jgi:hypothetical protein